MIKRKKKALVLMSGGLDSILAAKLLLEQKIEVTGLIFKSYFWKTDQAEKAAKQLEIPYRMVDFSQKHLKMVKNPPHGYGKAANPCVDCHLLMLKRAKDILDKEGFDLAATGEVLGERPFSQNKGALFLIAKKSGLNDLLLRPLSAKILPITCPEKEGWIDRDKLFDIQGRSRQKQIALAKKFGITDYPQPAGGCILTEKEFGKKLFNLLKYWPKATGDDIVLLRLGRHFWEGDNLIVLGKNQEENEKLGRMAKKNDQIIKPRGFPGPTALIRGEKVSKKTIEKTKKLILSKSLKAPKQPRFVVKLKRG